MNADRQTRQTDRQTDKTDKTNRQDRQTRQTDKTDRQDRQTDIKREDNMHTFLKIFVPKMPIETSLTTEHLFIFQVF
jgi:hypothetical protein